MAQEGDGTTCSLDSSGQDQRFMMPGKFSMNSRRRGSLCWPTCRDIAAVDQLKYDGGVVISLCTK